MPRVPLIFLSLLGIVLQIVLADAASCNLKELQKCKEGALKQVSILRGGGAENQKNFCSDLRDHFNCLLWQTILCFATEDVDVGRNVIFKISKYLQQEFCFKYGSWRSRYCYHSEAMRSCELLLPKPDSTNGYSCRTFSKFRECVLSVADNCNCSDRSLLNIYFADKGEEMAWECPWENYFTSISAVGNHPVNQEYSLTHGDSRRMKRSKSCEYSEASQIAVCNQNLHDSQIKVSKMDDEETKWRKLCCEVVPDFKMCITEICRDESEKLISSKMSPAVYKCKTFKLDTCRGVHVLTPCARASLLELEECGDKFRKSHQRVVNETKDIGGMLNRTCCEIQNYEACVVDVVTKACGSDANNQSETFIWTIIPDVVDQCKDYSRRSCDAANGSNRVNVATMNFLLYVSSFAYIKMLF